MNCIFYRIFLTEELINNLTQEANTYASFPVCVLFVLLPAANWVFETLNVFFKKLKVLAIYMFNMLIRSKEKFDQNLRQIFTVYDLFNYVN